MFVRSVGRSVAGHVRLRSAMPGACFLRKNSEWPCRSRSLPLRPAVSFVVVVVVVGSGGGGGGRLAQRRTS